MKPETADFLAKARRLLREAATMLDVDLIEAAGRTAYLAGFHAAQALIFEREDRTVKTHNGVHTGFARLMKDDHDLPADLRGFLPRTFEMKSIADYGIGPGAAVFQDEASEAIEAATRLIAFIEEKVANGPP